jgi:putative hydrolase of HD superfamily
MENNIGNLDIWKLFDFLRFVEKLKSTYRYNKKTDGTNESSADHSWRLSLLVIMLGDELNLNLDLFKSVKLAIVHDLAEAITGDIDAIKLSTGEVSKSEKEFLELNAMKKLQNVISGRIGTELFNLWKEYNSCTTLEAKFVKALDKIETLTQLSEAGHETYDKPEFIANYADKSVRDFPELKPVLAVLKEQLKSEFRKGNIEWKESYDLF